MVVERMQTSGFAKVCVVHRLCPCVVSSNNVVQPSTKAIVGIEMQRGEGGIVEGKRVLFKWEDVGG